MSKRLHSHLRTGLDLDGVGVDPEPEHHSPDGPQQRAEKRRRIEAIATQYLRGKMPLILSASLRGPFDSGWKNPWAKKVEPEKQRSPTTAGNARGGRHSRAPNTKVTRRPKKVDDKNNGARKLHRVVEHNDEQAGEQQGRIIAPTTSLAKEGHEQPEYSSANQTTPQTNPENYLQWLRRPSMDVDKSKTGRHTDPGANQTPTPSRYGRRPIDAPGELQFVPTTVPTKLTLNTGWRSSASTSMIISSPIKAGEQPPNRIECALQIDSVQPATVPSSVFISKESRPVRPLSLSPESLTRPTSPRPTTVDLVVQQQVSPIPTVTTSPAVLHLREADPLIVEGHRSAVMLARRAVEHASSQTRSHGPPSREEIQQFAERCSQVTPTASTTDPEKQRASRKTPNEGVPAHTTSHDLVASPAPASSTGFVYRKPGKTHAKEKPGQRPKPRPVTFGSSPAVPNDSRQEQQTDLRSSRQSNYSTQAAMMLAQLEFQEGTFPPASSETPHPQHNTPQPNMREQSPAITPFHTFNAELNKRHPLESAPREPQMSTQDLFTAASPFAFSTVKKKPVGPTRSSLRFAVLSNGEQNDHVDHGNVTKSPTPSAERVPLKDRNSRISFKSTSTVNASEKGSQDSPFQTPLPSTKDVELPRLDFHMSLDDIGPNGDLEFTDQFLRNLDGMT